ncbi:hypothetical protein [Coleofasciculus sp. H7-2]|uniref:hypothetical protein n=1 Tax=Coleofasciculus sp. H7-2 TaxID=3351545 RepID=UPI00366E5038
MSSKESILKMLSLTEYLDVGSHRTSVGGGRRVATLIASLLVMWIFNVALNSLCANESLLS